MAPIVAMSLHLLSMVPHIVLGLVVKDPEVTGPILEALVVAIGISLVSVKATGLDSKTKELWQLILALSVWITICAMTLISRHSK